MSANAFFFCKTWGDTGGEGAGHTLGALTTRLDWLSFQLKEHVYNLVAETVNLLALARMTASRDDVLEFGRRVFADIGKSDEIAFDVKGGYSVNTDQFVHRGQSLR